MTATMTGDKIEQLLRPFVDKVTTGDFTDWKKGWVGLGSGLPINHTTGSRYQGVNVLLLLILGIDYPQQRWATYKQWRNAGGQVRKGEHGIRLAKWGITYRCDDCAASGPEPCCDRATRHMWVRPFTVFNIAQQDGVDWQPDVELAPTTRLTMVDHWVEAVPARIESAPMGNQGAPHFDPRVNVIRMPDADQFDTTAAYYGTLFHELTHWTGQKDILDRHSNGGDPFGSEAYAAEELVAEFGAVILARHFGIDVDDDRHTAYLGGWFKRMADQDPMALYRAMRDAARAADRLLAYGKETE